MTIRIAIIQFPGSNCERETMMAVARSGMEPHEFLWNRPQNELADYHGFVIVGGFSYEDRARAGVMAAMDPIMQGIKEQIACGKPVLGICNGAQILVEAGCVPGLEYYRVGMALTDNKRVQNGTLLGTGYYNHWVKMRLSDDYQLNAFTRHLSTQDILSVPVAHAEGRFVIPPALLSEMQRNGQCVFQYCDADGKILESFPVNPNGSIHNIAAVSNKAGNVMAMMPHPERVATCDPIFQSMRDTIQDGYVQKVAPLNYLPRPDKIKKYQPHPFNTTLIVGLTITDNHAMSVNEALKHRGIATRIERYIHWELVCDSDETIQKVMATDLLYQDRKEKKMTLDEIKKEGHQLFLVRSKEDMIGQEKTQTLKKHFGLSGIHAILHGVLWQVESKMAEPIIHSSILYNPYAHDCYDY